MEEIKKTNLIEDIAIEEEMESSFIDYSMSVIISRAIPDARDGLKPIHRRILFAMNELGLHHNTSFKKSAKVVGEVIAKYHPHGDQAAYESLVRMAQKFSLRYPLVNGQGNFGSIDGDSAAAMRYTEAKLQKITELLMQDIDKDTVDFIDNYDASEIEPVVLPNKLPNLLINGSTGIAVGMATSIPPHNIKEVINAAIFLAKQFIKGEETFIEDLFAFIKGPDFPTGGEILNPSEIKEAYKTGRGRAIIRSKAEIREANETTSKSKIIIREIPYMINKSSLVKKIVEAAKNGRVNISNVSDESNRDGIRIVIELKRNTDPNVELNKLFKHTPLQTSFSINLLALDGTFPRVLNLKEALNIFLKHQNEILIRKTNFLLKKSEARIHVLEGLKLALDNIDWTINTIKSSLNRGEAISGLQKGPKAFQAQQNSIGAKIELPEFLTTKQAESILDMRLAKLTMLETKNLEIEIDKLISEIQSHKELLGSENLRYQNIIDYLEKISLDFGDERRTKISNIDILDMDDIDFVEQKDVAVILTETGYLKRISLDEYINQNRGGIGKKSIKTKDNDNVKQFVVSNTHSDLLFFTTKGKVYKLPTHTIIEPASKNTKGIPIVNYFKSDNGLIMDENEKVEVMIKMGNPLKDELVFVTKKGIIKKTKLAEFESINKNGKKAIKIDEDDEIFEVFSIAENDSYNILIGASNGKVINFDGDQIRTMSRVTRGVKGIKLASNHYVIGASSSLEGDKVLSVSENGFGKLSNLNDFREVKRGGKGVIAINTSKAGDLKALEVVSGDEDVIIITDKGTTIRISLSQIKELSRNTKGIKIVTLRDGESISKVRVITNVDDISNLDDISKEEEVSN